jgi:hypothetical protein
MLGDKIRMIMINEIELIEEIIIKSETSWITTRTCTEIRNG